MPDGGQVQRCGKEPTIVEDKFPEGMCVLAIDENPVCLRVLEVLLRVCKFNPTVVMDAKTALRILREGRAEQFDLVITDMHMSDMDDFKLLEIIVLEMDLPVIMLSVDGDNKTMLKGINHGACDCLVKPVRLKELKLIWKHVIRKRLAVVNHNNNDSDGVDQRVQTLIVEGNQGGTKSIKFSKKNKNDGDDSYENKYRTSVATRKKKRVTWTSELHRRFTEVINRLGIDNAVPRKILQMMNVNYLTRESVASHLQKYRLYLKRVTKNPRRSNPLDNSFEKGNSSNYMNMNHHGNSSNYQKHQRGLSSSTIGFEGSNNSYIAPSMLRAQGASMQSMNWKMETFGHGCDMIRRHYLGPPVRSFTKVTYNTMLDTFPPTHSHKAYANFLREKLLETSNAAPSSYTNNCFPKTSNGGLLNYVNQLQVQPPELVTEFSALTNATSSKFDERQVAQIPNHVGSSSNPWHKNMVPSSFPDHIDRTPLAQSQVNVPQINQLSSFRASPGQMSMFENEYQNEMAGIINNNTSRGDFSEKTAPLFNMESNTGSIEISSDNFSPMTLMVNGGSTNSPLPHIPTGNSVVSPTHMVNIGSIIPTLNDIQASFVVPTQILNRDNTVGVHLVQEEPSDEQALNDQPNYIDPLFSEDIFTDMLNQDFNEELTFFGGEW